MRSFTVAALLLTHIFSFGANAQRKVSADTVAPVLKSNLASTSITNNNKVRITITDASAVTTQIFKENVLIATQKSKRFDLILTEGVNSFVLKAVDASQNKATDFALSNVILDKTKPFVSSSVNASVLTNSNKVQITITDASSVLSQVFRNGELLGTQASKSFEVTLVEGVNNLRVIATDQVGNKTDFSVKKIILDSIAPKITANLSSNTSTKTASIKIAVNDVNSVSTKIIRNGQFLRYETKKSFDVPLIEGSNSFVLIASDGASNQSAEFLLSNIILDTKPPVLTSSVSSNSTTTSNKVQITISDASDVTTQVLKGGVVIATYTSKMFDISLTAGRNDFVLKAVDKLQNKASNFNLSNIRVTPDTVPPVITSSVSTSAIVSSDKINIIISDASPVTTEVFRSSQLVETIQGNAVQLTLLEGVNNLRIKVTDTQNNVTELHLNGVVLDTIQPVVASQAQPNSITKLNAIRVTVSDATSVTTKVFRNDSLIDTKTVNEFDVPLVEGSNKISLKSVDAANNQSQDLEISGITLDSISPLIVSDITSGSTVTSDKIHVVISDASAVTTQILKDGVVVLQDNALEFDLALSPGVNNYSVHSLDAAGNESILEITNVNYDVGDSEGPKILVYLLQSGVFTVRDQVPIRIIDDSNVTTNVFNNGEQIIFEASGDIGITLQEGINNIKIVSKDQYNNETILELDQISYALQPVIVSPHTGMSTSNPELNLVSSGGPIGSLVQAVLNYSSTYTGTTIGNGYATLTLNLIEGLNHLAVRFIDSFGEQSPSSELDVILDTVAPNIFSTIDPNNRNHVIVTIEDQSQNVYTTILRNEETISIQDSKSFELDLEGGAEYLILSMDEAGNRSEYYLYGDSLDNTAPVITVTPVLTEEEPFTKINTIHVSIEDESSVTTEIRRNGELLLIEVGSYFEINLEEGFNGIDIIAIDALGNSTTLSAPFNLDTTPPVIFTSAYSGMVTNSVSLFFNMQDAFPGFFTFFNNGVMQTGFSNHVFLNEGINNVRVVATDLVGNSSELEIGNIVLDSTAPVLVFNPDPYNVPSSMVNSTILQVSVSDATTVTTKFYRQNGRQLQVVRTETGKSFDITLNEGPNSHMMESVDSAGNIKKTNVFVIRDTISPTLSTSLQDSYQFNSFPRLVTASFEFNEYIRLATFNNQTAINIDSRKYQYTFQVNGPGIYNAVIKGFDFAGNEVVLQKEINFILNSANPVITTNSIPPVIISNYFDLDISISQTNFVETKLYVNDQLKVTTNDLTFSNRIEFDANEIFQERRVTIISRDSAGNQANKTFVITKDTNSLYVQIISPQNRSVLNTTLIDVRARANKQLAVAKINGQIAAISQDGYSLRGAIEQPIDEGQFPILIEVTDVDGSTATHQIQTEVKLNSLPSWVYEECRTE